jgi:hypothetical protein
LPAGLKLARVAYVTFAVAVLLALLKLNDFSGAKPFILKIVSGTPSPRPCKRRLEIGRYPETRRWV